MSDFALPPNTMTVAQGDYQCHLPNWHQTNTAKLPIHPYHLGASLYMPATRSDIWQVINRSKLDNINSVIICIEDAVSESDVAHALAQIQTLLTTWFEHINKPSLLQDALTTFDRPLVFIRPRHPQMLLQLAEFNHIDLIDGFVLPKVDMDSLSHWRVASQSLSPDSLLMPTLETARVYDSRHNQELAIALNHAFDEKILALRIGGNDLFATLRLRRPNNTSIYTTAIGMLIHQLLGTFVPHGFYLTAPVFEYLEQPTVFMQELTQDVALGLVGKTVIHPTQIPLVHQAFCVPTYILNEAKAILATDAKAVFKYNNAMLEPATHRAWAAEVVERAQVFGVADGLGQLG